MAGQQIKSSKGTNDLYDAGRGHVCAEKIQPLPDNMKKKISVIREAIPSKSKSEIAEVLQSCDYDVEKALNCFYADGGMDEQNEWMVQGKRKNKKKRKPKKDKDASISQSANVVENPTAPDPKPEKQAESGQKEVGENIVNEPKVQPTDKPITTSEDSPKSLENLKPQSNSVSKPSETTSILTSPPPLSPMSPPPLSPLLSPTDSTTSSLQDSQASNKSRAGSSTNEKHPRVRTTSGSGSEVIKRSLKDLERSSVSIARYQSKIDEQADLSTKTLTKSFQAIREALNEREKYLQAQLESVIEEAKKLLEERQLNAAGLKFKCNRVGSMTDEETSELRNEIKHFVGERRIDEDLGKTIKFIRDQEKLEEDVKNFGEVPAIKHHYTPYKRKYTEPPKPITYKPPPMKATTASNNDSTTTTTTSNETKSTHSKNDKRPVLSPSRLKDQAEIHARLQQAVKEQQVSPASKEGSKQSERTASEKPKPKDVGPKFNRNNNSREQQGNSRRQPQRERQTSSSQNFNSGNRNEKKLPNDHKTAVKADGAKAQSGNLAEGASQAQDGSPADKGTQDGSSADNSAQVQQEKPAESKHVTPNQGNRVTKRRYIRKSPSGEGSSTFRTGTVDTSGNPSSIKENGEEGKSSDLPNGQLESPMTNGTNGFVPLPQRNHRPRKFYYRKDPGSKIEFPPARENGSVPA